MTSTFLKPIETLYKGYHFRSRLEARYAVFFDSMKSQWTYETEGYNLSNGERYLPDFKLFTPQGEPIWIEVKPSNIKTDPKFVQFQKDCEMQRTMLVSGDPVDHFGESAICPRCGITEPAANYHYVVNGQRFIEYCIHCDFETPCGGDHPLRTDGLMGCHYRPHKGDICAKKESLVTLASNLRIAAMQARRARFEHGECG